MVTALITLLPRLPLLQASSVWETVIILLIENWLSQLTKSSGRQVLIAILLTMVAKVVLIPRPC
jgi:hypothetical protein